MDITLIVGGLVAVGLVAFALFYSRLSAASRSRQGAEGGATYTSDTSSGTSYDSDASSSPGDAPCADGDSSSACDSGGGGDGGGGGGGGD